VEVAICGTTAWKLHCFVGLTLVLLVLLVLLLVLLVLMGVGWGSFQWGVAVPGRPLRRVLWVLLVLLTGGTRLRSRQHAINKICTDYVFITDSRRPTNAAGQRRCLSCCHTTCP